MPVWVTGNNHTDKIMRCICAAGHKCIFSYKWGGLPAKKFLAELEPKLAGLRNRLFVDAYTSSYIAGYITEEVAEATGLPAGIAVGCGAFGAHHGAVGAGINHNTMS